MRRANYSPHSTTSHTPHDIEWVDRPIANNRLRPVPPSLSYLFLSNQDTHRTMASRITPYHIGVWLLSVYLGTAPIYWLPGVSLQAVAAAKALLASLAVLAVLVEAIFRNQLRLPTGLLGPPGLLILVLLSTPGILQAETPFQARSRFLFRPHSRHRLSVVLRHPCQRRRRSAQAFRTIALHHRGCRSLHTVQLYRRAECRLTL